MDIAHRRLHNQHIIQHVFEKPDEVVQWLGAVQSQDYAAAKWAVGLRLRGATNKDVEQAFTDGAILRTHVMRPTWHFVSPLDIHWLLALTAPRVQAGNASRYSQLELDEAIFKRSNAVLRHALEGGKQRTRAELASVLQQAGIAVEDTQRLTYLIMNAELEGVLCSGARRGNQFTYALLDERVPQWRTLERDEALAELTRRYFTSHGPATLHDFVWWSGLTMADARAGIAMVSSQLVCERVGEQTYWMSSSTLPAQNVSRHVYLLPNFDEYTVSYKDRSAVVDALHSQDLSFRGSILFSHTIVIDGQIVGTWKRTVNKHVVTLTPSFFASPDQYDMHTFVVAAQRYSAFLEQEVRVAFL